MSGPSTELARIVSGGQTGADRAALDAALACGVACGGWCPRGRLAEDGPIPARYPLRETPDPDPEERTRWNVRDSDATLVFGPDPPAGGTALAVEEAHRLGRPVLHSALVPAELPRLVAWLGEHRIRCLNVAGPRESEMPGLEARARSFLCGLLEAAAGGPQGDRSSGAQIR